MFELRNLWGTGPFSFKFDLHLDSLNDLDDLNNITDDSNHV